MGTQHQTNKQTGIQFLQKNHKGMMMKIILLLSAFLIVSMDCAPSPLDVAHCKECNTGSIWPPFENAGIAKGYWQLQAEKNDAIEKVKISPTPVPTIPSKLKIFNN